MRHRSFSHFCFRKDGEGPPHSIRKANGSEIEEPVHTADQRKDGNVGHL
jgi:hypothetical protein